MENTLAYWKANAEEDYIKTPISVLKYISELEVIAKIERKDLTRIHHTKVFYQYLYPIYAKDFLLGGNYEHFAALIQKDFILSPEQWETILNEWEFKETRTDIQSLKIPSQTRLLSYINTRI